MDPSVSTRGAMPGTHVEQGRGGRVDGELKVTGRMTYAADIRLPGMLYAAVLRSPYPHARIVRIDTSAAEQQPGVHLVLTGSEVAGLRYGRLVRDVPVLAVDKVRYVGERVAAVAAESRAVAERAAAAIRVEYEPLPPVFDPEEALRPEAPAVHAEPWRYAGAVIEAGGPPNLQARHVWSKGDVASALSSADFQFEERFYTSPTHHGYIEPHTCVAHVDAGGRIHVWASNKSPYRLRAQLARALGVPETAIVIHPVAVGGDFGGKGSPMDVPLCVELARRTGRPVCIRQRYTEDLMAAGSRHASVVTVRAGVSRDGILQALDVRVVFNVGAYAGLRPLPNLHGAEEAGSSYRIPAIRIESLCVHTNQIPGGHKRAPGAVQVTFAIESTLDIIAARLGLDPIEIRRRNLLCTGDPTPLGEHWPDSRGVDTLEAAVHAFRPAFPVVPPPHVRFGRGVAVYSRPTRVGNTSLRLYPDSSGFLVAEVPQPEQGTGAHTVVREVLARELDVPAERIAIRHVGTGDLPHDDGVGGSRVTASASEAAHRAAALFREKALAAAAVLLGVDRSEVAGVTGGFWEDRQSGRRVGMADLADWAASHGEDLAVLARVERAGEHGQGALGFCVQIAQVGVDTETGQVFVYELLTVHDVANIVNPRSHRVQIEGGAVFGLGEALLEDLAIAEGKVTASNLGDYKIPSIRDVPPIRVVYLPGGRGVGAANVKGVGEMSNVPVAAAIANAVADAVGVRIRTLPITAEKIFAALQGTDE